MPYMKVMDLGNVEVRRLPKKIPKTVKLFGKTHRVDKDLYKLIWASKYATARARKKILKVL